MVQLMLLEFMVYMQLEGTCEFELFLAYRKHYYLLVGKEETEYSFLYGFINRWV